jgi:hypothetical protein
MKKLAITLAVASLVLVGASLATAADLPQAPQGMYLPQALQGVDLSQAQAVSDTEAKVVKGSAVCPDPVYNYSNNYAPGLNLYPKDYKYLGTK